MDTFETILRRIIREELELAGLSRATAPPLEMGIRRTRSSIVGLTRAVLSILADHPEGLTSSMIGEMTYDPSFGTMPDYMRSVVNATHGLKKKKLIDADDLGGRAFRFRINDQGRLLLPPPLARTATPQSAGAGVVDNPQ